MTCPGWQPGAPLTHLVLSSDELGELSLSDPSLKALLALSLNDNQLTRLPTGLYARRHAESSYTDRTCAVPQQHRA